ncbi:ROK family transcriptional regulator [Staphylococcus succinus]|nr:MULTISPECIES: ROK family transcriptional regulator [Staphylococcus]MDH9161628.1 ROK family transcriptional regulator [Staphylococcus succinus]PNZ21678.1 ROK family transcriptional regulator [Staphylococcus succinus subsp. succinus]PTI44263.1 ROK family transcriptional regulator [Staphylococcus succinus]PTJ19353.1 ROK family transcriptional regulator [Staphylococcus succinus]RIN26933.1 ROK family transcriptional regulator [Staphylococcus succinus]
MDELNVLKLDENQKRVIQQIFKNKLISRIQISKNLGINKATISNILNKLKDKGFVNEVGQGKSTKSGGRKPILLEINPHFGYVISMDIAYHSIELMYNYFDGKILKHESIPLTNNKMSSILEVLANHIDSEEKYQTNYGLLGMSISIHGIVNDNQEITHLPFHDIENISITEKLKTIADVPVIVENEANLSAIYERDYGSHKNINNLITLSIHKGIGAGLIIDKKLYRGTNGEAGEIGKTLVSTYENGEKVYYKIEDLCSQEALIQTINSRMQSEVSIDKIKDLYYDHNPIITEEIKQFSTRIAILIHNLNTQISPEAIYINCPLINEIPEILEDIKNEFIIYTSKKVHIKLTSNVQYATLLGAALAITQKLLDIEHIKLNF